MAKDVSQSDKAIGVAVAAFLVIVGVIFGVFVVQGKCDAGQSWMGCSFKGTVLDYLGAIFFYGALVAFAYVSYKGTLFTNLTAPAVKLAWLVSLLLGIGLIFIK